MSEKNKRGAAVNGPGKVGAVKVTPGADGNKFSVALIKLASGFEKLCKDAGGLEEYQQVLDSRTGLHQELEQQKREMQELNRRMNDIQQQKDEEVGQLQSELSESNRSIEILLHQFGGKYMDWDADKSQHDKESAELSQLKDELERTQNEAKISKSETKRLQEELNKTEKQLEKEINSTDTLKNRLQRKILECEEATNRLNKYETKLKKMQNDLGILRIDESQVTPMLEKVASKFHQLVWQYFDNDILDPNITISVSEQSLSQIPQVTSNSPAARCIRCAFAEAVIAQELLRHIFQDFYFAEDVIGIETGALIKKLDRMNGSHLTEATIIRCQLARVCKDLSSEIPGQAAKSVYDILNVWLNDEKSQKQQFLENLTNLYAEAMTLWQTLQRSQNRVRVVMDLKNDLWVQEEDTRKSYDDIKPKEGQPIPSVPLVNPLAVLFPQIVTDDTFLFHGYALFHTQSAVIVATQECKNQRNLQDIGINHRRRMSRGGRADVNEQRMKATSRLSSASRDGSHQRTVPSISSELS